MLQNHPLYVQIQPLSMPYPISVFFRALSLLCQPLVELSLFVSNNLIDAIGLQLA